jgi:N-carbamoyl-L-amino-acid hydrolase
MEAERSPTGRSAGRAGSKPVGAAGRRRSAGGSDGTASTAGAVPAPAAAAGGAAADATGPDLADAFTSTFDGLAGIGALGDGDGWRRFAWTEEDQAARAWFEAEAGAAGLTVEPDRAGNLWAWWGEPGPDAVVTGSHLDTVAGGGAYDGALGVVSALLAVRELRAAGVTPARPLAVVAFADEEGGRFNLPCFGSRVLAGHLDPATVLARRDADGTTLAEALGGFGVDPRGLGPDPELLGRVSCFVELHVEQGRGLAGTPSALAVGSGIWPHGRWRLELTGEANHAGTTRLLDRRDPALVLAAAITEARGQAKLAGAVATIGRIQVQPNGANGIPSRVTAWLDARAPDDVTLDRLVDGWEEEIGSVAGNHGVGTAFEVESRSPAVTFDIGLRTRLKECLARLGHDRVELPTAAGHDAGALAADVPTAMLFVRNPTGASHSPSERAELDDCVTGVRALAAILEDLACH